jgi:ferritin-like metal-binding protein YciE
LNFFVVRVKIDGEDIFTVLLGKNYIVEQKLEELEKKRNKKKIKNVGNILSSLLGNSERKKKKILRKVVIEVNAIQEEIKMQKEIIPIINPMEGYVNL